VDRWRAPGRALGWAHFDRPDLRQTAVTIWCHRVDQRRQRPKPTRAVAEGSEVEGHTLKLGKITTLVRFTYGPDDPGLRAFDQPSFAYLHTLEGPTTERRTFRVTDPGRLQTIACPT